MVGGMLEGRRGGGRGFSFFAEGELWTLASSRTNYV